ncbi:MAG: rRNA maturation RNase YbeY [Candidatus Zambryskibacteria bacterium RIFOXYC1_FULL_39_10]|uniref:Endoribonuclease YbeY n=1 Tax=Candidatus Zambryskibacteria bacterium RIFOXYC1_FULL_39_10 TaxID=1802779 RepID=A0A1G2V2K7_9BACT|nr:MAG: rRNA maturation RNase YbeY [Candidatus Zambryskibacteria bacterium RIFOXYC1_FULL_39_10]OHB16912.1 MAG: rRNA maturation RNase YbeY [Candidatus Zambryskibacteria bacterium RIFOXYD1_FULL_39_35]
MIEVLKDLEIKEIKNDILGKDYDLSVRFVSENKIKELNKKYRKINKPTDILSFEISDKMGEIFICKSVANKKAKDFADQYPDYILFLVIHGCFHLKGMEHGVKMERYEFTHYSRYRHRDI